MAWYSSLADLGSGIAEVTTFGHLKGAFKDDPKLFGKSIKDLDPTKVKPVETGALQKGTEEYGKAATAAQAGLKEYMAGIQAPTIAKTAGPQAGQISAGFLEALQNRLPTQQAALAQAQTMGAGARAMTAESAELMRQAALGNLPTAAQVQQKQAFEQAVAAQMAAQAGRGYDPAAIRQAQVAGQQLQAQQAQQAAVLSAQEQQAARAQYAQTAQGQQQLAMQAQELQLKAAAGDVNAQVQLAGLQADIAKAQAGMQTQTSIAGAQIASGEATAQAQLQQQTQAQMNALMQYYLNLGMEPAKAQMEAQRAIFGAEWQRSQMQTEARQKAFGTVLGGAGDIAAMYAGG